MFLRSVIDDYRSIIDDSINVIDDHKGFSKLRHYSLMTLEVSFTNVKFL